MLKVTVLKQQHVENILNEIMESKTQITWDDIAGLDFAKKSIKEIVVWPMLRPDIFKVGYVFALSSIFQQAHSFFSKQGLRGPPKVTGSVLDVLVLFLQRSSYCSWGGSDESCTQRGCCCSGPPEPARQ